MKINLIPMAGEGQRYKNEGYLIPKPLIDIDGLPMVVRAAKALPSADRYIFVCRKEHIEQAKIDKVLAQYFDNPVIVVVDYLTEGQAMTCLLARDFIPPDAMLTIGASDYDITYNKATLEEMDQDMNCDGWVWTFRNNPLVLQNPNMYGWVKKDTANKVHAISCKKTISDTPLNDPALIGAFTFKKAASFFEATDRMVALNDRINNEFYVDVAVNHVIQAGKNIKNFEINRYIGWGVPKDLKMYNYWKSYFIDRGLG